MTPLRQQYLRIKKQFPDTVVMFRLGDFYETFDDDAEFGSPNIHHALVSWSKDRWIHRRRWNDLQVSLAKLRCPAKCMFYQNAALASIGMD